MHRARWLLLLPAACLIAGCHRAPPGGSEVQPRPVDPRTSSGSPTPAGDESAWRAADERERGGPYTEEEWRTYRDSRLELCDDLGDDLTQWSFILAASLRLGHHPAHEEEWVSYACPEHLDVLRRTVAWSRDIGYTAFQACSTPLELRTRRQQDLVEAGRCESAALD